MEAVNLEAFERSAAALRRALALFEAHRHGELAVMSRNSVILEFEICFGQMRSPLERCLIRLDAVPPEEVRTMSYPMLMRSAAQHGYTKVDWKAYREARNETAHAYSETKAEEIAAKVPLFLEAVEAMITTMRSKQAIS